MKKFRELLRTSMIYVFPILALILSLYANETSLAAKKALYLCLDVVIPSLFPFFVLSRLAVPYLYGFSCPKFLKSLTERFFGLPYYTLITIILGYLSGFPTGAKLARDMFDEGLLDSQQASKVITVANNCSPLFIIGTIGAGLFKSVKIGFLLLTIHWISGLIAVFLTGRFANYKKSQKKIAPQFQTSVKKDNKPIRLSYLLPSAVEEAAFLCIKVTGYIVLFAVLSELLSRLGIFSFLAGIVGLIYSGGALKSGFSDFMASLFRGFMEIASGSQAINQIQGTTINIKLAAISLICGFAGFSVHTQVMGIMKGTEAKYRVFFTGKLLHGIIAGLITLLVIDLVPITVQISTLAVRLPFNYLSVRLITIGVILLSLCIAPYRTGHGSPHQKPGPNYQRRPKAKRLI